MSLSDHAKPRTFSGADGVEIAVSSLGASIIGPGNSSDCFMYDVSVQSLNSRRIDVNRNH